MSLIHTGLSALSIAIAASTLMAVPATAQTKSAPAGAACASGYVARVTGDYNKPEERLCLTPDTTGIDVKVGEVFSVNLPGNAGTGAIWALRSMPESVMLLGTGQVPARDCKPGMVGCANTTAFTFKVVAATGGTLAFTHGRPWEQDAWQTISVVLNVH